MPQSFRPFNTKEERTLLARGEEITMPQALKASNYRVLRVHVHKENTHFFIDQLMECQFQMHEVAEKLVNTPLFRFEAKHQGHNCSTKGYPKHLYHVLYQSLIHMLQGSHLIAWKNTQLAHVLEMAFVIWSLILAWLN
jgi:hypothetical protein